MSFFDIFQPRLPYLTQWIPIKSQVSSWSDDGVFPQIPALGLVESSHSGSPKIFPTPCELAGPKFPPKTVLEALGDKIVLSKLLENLGIPQMPVSENTAEKNKGKGGGSGLAEAANIEQKKNQVYQNKVRFYPPWN